MKKCLQYYLYAILLVSSKNSLIAQKQNNQWRIGGTGISFNAIPPSQVQGSAMNTPEGSASVADRNTGELLFYTNGVTVWNAQNQVMLNGTGLRGGSASDLSSTTAAVIVPKPGSNMLYYIITVDEGASGSGSGGIRYNLVDMSLDGGLGGIVPGQKNVFLFQTGTEKLEVVPAANGTDIWVLTHDYSTFVAFRLGPDGILPNPVQSQVSGDLANTAGHLKVNRQFNMLACGSTFEQKLRLFNFNNATGVVSDLFAIPLNPIILGNSPLIYGVEFSPNGRFLYINNLNSIFQYDVSLSTLGAIQASAYLIDIGGQPASMQIGPDRKIYINNGALQVINCPDKPGNLCGFDVTGLFGGGYGLPKWVHYPGDSFPSVKNNIIARDTCFGDSVRFSIASQADVLAVSWSFGDPASGGQNAASGPESIHAFSSAGFYNVRAILSTACGFDTLFLNNLEIKTCNAPPCTGSILASGDSCEGSLTSFSVSGPPILSVKWNFGDPASGFSNFSSEPSATHRFSGEGTFLITAIATFSCGTDTITFSRTIFDCDCSGEIMAMVPDSCSREVSFSIASDENIQLLSWNFGDPESGVLNSAATQAPLHRFTSSGTYQVKLVALFDCGLDTLFYTIRIPPCSCSGEITATLSDSCAGEVLFSVQSDESILLLSWNFGDPASGILNASSALKPGHEFRNPGSYTVRSVVLFDCGLDTLQKEIEIRGCDCRISIPNAIIPNGDTLNEGFYPLANCAFEEYDLMVYNRWGSLIFRTDKVADKFFSNPDNWSGQKGDVYFYVLRYRFPRSEVRRASGSISVLR